MSKTDLTIRVPVSAPANVVFDAMTDWERQSSWMLATQVHSVGPQNKGVGDRLEAFTGIRTPFGSLGFLDTMVVSDWVPGRSVTVVHTGKIVRGSGTFSVTPQGTNSSEIAWNEDLRIPGGALGKILWSLTSPISRWAVRYSLTKFAQQLEDKNYGHPVGV